MSRLGAGSDDGISRRDITRLAGTVRGQLVARGDHGYDEARATWELWFDHQPDLVVLAEDVADVVTTVRFAGEHTLPLTVQATGHGPVRPVRGGVLLSLARLRGVRLDGSARQIAVEGGALWGSVVEAGRPVGLAPVGGLNPWVGVVGTALGGGLGWLSRQHGLTCDTLRACQVVLPNGQLVTANRENEPELFWGLRGGGGGLGVVTSMTLAMPSVSKVLGGQRVFPLPAVRDTLRRWRDWTMQAADEVTSIATLTHGPTDPAVPPFLRNQTTLTLTFCYAGSPSDGQKVTAPLTEIPGAVVSHVNSIPFAGLADLTREPQDPTWSFGRSAFLDEFNDDAIDAALAVAGPREGAPPGLIEFRHLGGAVARVPETATAASHRGKPYLTNMRSLVTGEEEAAQAIAYADRFAAATRPWSDDSAPPTFLFGDEGQERERAAFSDDTRARLARLKQALDPTGLLGGTRTPTTA